MEPNRVSCLEIFGISVEKESPATSFAIRNQFYINDLLGGADSLEKAMELRKKIHNTLASVSFHLRKYQSRIFINS